MMETMTWAEFRFRYQATLRGSLRVAWYGAAKQLEQYCQPELLSDVSEVALTKCLILMRADGQSIETLRDRLWHLRRALRWGFDVGLIDPSLFDVRNRAKAGDKPNWQWSSRSWYAKA